MRWSQLLLIAGLVGPAFAQGDPAEGLNAFVDRASARISAELGAEPEHPKMRPIVPARAEGERATITGAVMAAPVHGIDRITLTVAMPGAGPRLLLVDAGAVFRGPGGADYVLVPNQKFLLQQAQTLVEAEALPLWPEAERPAPQAPLRAAWTNDPGLLAVLRTAQRLEADDTTRLSRYVKEKDGLFVVDTFLDNQDVRLAKRMSWSRNVVGALEGRLARDDLRFAIFAVTAGYTITETVDWLRLHRKMAMEPAIAAMWEMVPGVEYLLERATLNHRIFSPRHAEYHFNQGVAAYQRNDLEAAKKAFDKALEKRADMVDAQYNLAVLLYRQGRHEAAKSEFLVASGMQGASADVFYNRGATLFRLGDKLGAARAFRKALALSPEHVEAGEWLPRADPEGKTAPKPKKSKKRRRGKRRRR